MQKLNSDGTLSEFNWQIIDEQEDTSDGQVLLPVKSFINNQHGDQNGVWISSDDDLGSLSETIHSARAVGIMFPVFADGRGFSTARWVREKLQYKGEIIAIGNFMQDQLHYLKRCGFDAFAISHDADIASMVASLSDFSDAYQASADKPTPLFRRR